MRVYSVVRLGEDDLTMRMGVETMRKEVETRGRMSKRRTR